MMCSLDTESIKNNDNGFSRFNCWVASIWNSSILLNHWIACYLSRCDSSDCIDGQFIRVR